MPYSLILDVLVAVLLVVTIAYAVVLNRRLGRLRSDKQELERLAHTFGESTVRAEESIGRLKHTADALQQRMDKATALRDDLAFLLERGDAAADRLEGAVRTARIEAGGAPLPVGTAGLSPPAVTAESVAAQAAAEAETETETEEGQPRSEAERALLKAIRSAG